MADDVSEAEEVDCCCAAVWKRDTYRRTGRGKSGFEMHYTKNQCSRAATKDGRCWQHQDKTRFSIESHYYHRVQRRSAAKARTKGE